MLKHLAMCLVIAWYPICACNVLENLPEPDSRSALPVSDVSRHSKRGCSVPTIPLHLNTVLSHASEDLDTSVQLSVLVSNAPVHQTVEEILFAGRRGCVVRSGIFRVDKLGPGKYVWRIAREKSTKAWIRLLRSPAHLLLRVGQHRVRDSV